MNKQQIIEAFAEMARMKNIDRDLLQGIMEDTFAQMVRKKYGQEAEFEIVVNMDKGDIEIYLIREVVESNEDVEDPSLQIRGADSKFCSVLSTCFAFATDMACDPTTLLCRRGAA